MTMAADIKRLLLLCAAFVFALLAWVESGKGYLVGPPLNLEQLSLTADIIFKGTAISNAPAADKWFEPCPGFVVRETEFKVVSVIQGAMPGGTLQFRHFDTNPKPGGYMFEPQHYHFDVGRTYIVFAKGGETTRVFRQLWLNHKGIEDQGVLLCPDDRPLAAKTVKQAFGDEMTLMLRSASADDVKYALQQLDQMSGGG